MTQDQFVFHLVCSECDNRRCLRASRDIIEDWHGKGSTMITSQLPVKGWYDAIGEKTVADAVLDRPVHQSNRYVWNYRESR